MKRLPVRSVVLCGKEGSRSAATLGTAMCHWFSERGVACASCAHDELTVDFVGQTVDADLVVVLGGDGTFVSVARKLSPAPRPVIGVNLGRVGFLAEVSPESWREDFARMLELGVTLEEGLGLAYSLERDGNTLLQGLSVNDLVMSRGGPARLVSLALTVDGVHLAVLRADGLIISTPTGSTGYTGSARGPLLHPGLKAYAVTPICPFMSNFLPLVVSGETQFSITVKEAGPEIYLTVDGQESLKLAEGDVVRVSGKERGIVFARIDTEGYFAKLRFAGFVRDFAE